MSIQDLLSKPASSLPPGATCAEAARRMRRQNVGCIVIEREGEPIGIVTDRDLAMRVVADELDPASVTVGSVMSELPAFLTAQHDLGEAIRTMRDMGVRRLPVVNSSGRSVGLLSLDDALVALAEQLNQVRELLLSESRAVDGDSVRASYVAADARAVR